jgi:hypothetical protein
LVAILHMEPQPLEPTIPRDLDKVVMRCLRKDPARRFQNMGDVKVELEELKEESEAGALEGTAAVERKRRRWWPWAAVGAVTLGAALFLLGQRWERGRSSPPVFRQLTFRRGTIYSARFAPDGHTIVYGAY